MDMSGLSFGVEGGVDDTGLGGADDGGEVVEAGGGDGHVYFYNYDSGYCSGVVPVIPKSLE